MKRTGLLVALSFSVLFTFANDPVEPIPTNSSHIEGKVVDSKTGEALVGVSLKINGSNHKTFTDLRGYFLIENISPGTYNIDIDYVSYKGITLKKVEALSPEVKLKVELESASIN